MLANNELERMWKDATLTSLRHWARSHTELSRNRRRTISRDGLEHAFLNSLWLTTYAAEGMSGGRENHNGVWGRSVCTPWDAEKSVLQSTSHEAPSSLHPSVTSSLLSLPLWGTGLISQFLDHFTVGRTPWTGDQLVAKPIHKHRTTQTQKNIHIPKIHALSGIRTHDPGFRPLGYRDRPSLCYVQIFLLTPCSQTPSICIFRMVRETVFHTHTKQQAKLKCNTIM
jgi:hypothetical protein